MNAFTAKRILINRAARLTIRHALQSPLMYSAASFNEMVFGSFVFRPEQHYQNLTAIERGK